ncbi:MAG: N-acetyltransferase [Candidatus Omnitrophica bacterium]|nr:N-acetyltransferase [Candidatus Omnitrophota bacterium]
MAKSARVKKRFAGVRIHPTAMIEPGVEIGAGSSIWDHVHIRSNAVLGRECIVGEKTYIAYDVRIGDFVKLNAFVYIPTGVTIEDKVMISAGCLFVNDKYPRAYDYSSKGLAGSAPNEDTLATVVKEGATVGAGAVILGGLEIGRFALVGAGSVVTKSVPAHALVVGNPARQIGWVCVCGRRLLRERGGFHCRPCEKKFSLKGRKIFGQTFRP